jgi:hypothetical protein
MVSQLAKRDQTAIADIKTRLREPLRAKLERAAKRHGVSMNAEIGDRLERTFRQEDAFGGPDGRLRAHLMLSAFNTAGQRQARDKRITGAWTDDPECYLAASFAAIDALMNGAPGTLDLDTAMVYVESFKQRLAARIVNRRNQS